MTNLSVIGVDPGSTVGVVEAKYLDVGTSYVQLRRAKAVQAGDSFEVDVAILPRLASSTPGLLAIERFVIGRASMRSGHHGRRTAEMVGEITRRAELAGWTVVQRSAAQVKPWATDRRLEAAGLLKACKGMRHARDAARHALFAAVHDGGIPDPLSKEWNR